MVLVAFTERGATGVDDDTLNAIRSDGGLVLPDQAQPGITDVVVPILRSNGREAVAALTVPYVATSYSPSGLDVVRESAARAALEIQVSLGI